MASRPIRTPVAGPDFTPLPAAPIKGKVTKLSVSSAAATSHVLEKDTSMVRLLIKGGAVYVDENAEVTADCEELTPGSGTVMYDTRGVTPGATLSFRAVTGTVFVQVKEF